MGFFSKTIPQPSSIDATRVSPSTIKPSIEHPLIIETIRFTPSTVPEVIFAVVASF
jgi:hypothetical protein